MRKLFFLFFSIFIATASFSQDKNTEDKDVLKYTSLEDLEFTKKIRNHTSYESYIGKDGVKISIGDTITLGKAEGKQENTVKAAYGASTYQAYSYVFQGRYFGLQQPIPISSKYEGTKLIITDILVYHTKLSKNSILEVCLYAKDPNAPKLMGMNMKSILSYEKAIGAGEVYTKNKPLSRAEAIAKLKEAKDLLDLGLMKQEDYDKLKAELSSIIMQDK